MAPSRGHAKLYRAALARLSLAFGQKLLALKAAGFIKAASEVHPRFWQEHGAVIQQVSNLVQTVLCVGALFYEPLRRRFAMLVLLTLALVPGFLAALAPTPLQSSITAESTLFTVDEETGVMRLHYEALNPQEITQALQQLHWTVPLAVFFSLNLPPTLGRALAPIAAALMPYAWTRWQAAAAGWDQLSWMAGVGTVLAGALSAFSCWWLLSCTWKLSGGHGMLNDPLSLTDPQNGSDSADAAFVAVSVMIHWILTPVWLFVYGVRTWLWVLSCGMLFGASGAKGQGRDRQRPKAKTH